MTSVLISDRREDTPTEKRTQKVKAVNDRCQLADHGSQILDQSLPDVTVNIFLEEI